jgi:DnaJ-class molecular chaperone
MSILNEIAELITECSHCDGSGIMPTDETSACNFCGGQGERLEATGLISDIRAAIKELSKTPKKGYYETN